MKYKVLLLILGVGLFSWSKSEAQSKTSVYDYWKYEQTGASEFFYKSLSEKGFAYLKDRAEHVSSLESKEDWIGRQAEVRQKLSEALGPFPQKTPLNPVITGTLKKKGYTVEKLHYESRPGYHVTAALFLPDDRPKKAPAIIFSCGHTTNGFRSDVYQHMILNYVKKGFIVLAFDPIGQGERIQYSDTERIKGATAEHSYPGAQSFIAGISPANYFIWDGIRTVDYLLTRQEVDPARIGITGRSGGGTQTAYIAAMDDRILAAAPECYITSYDKLLRSNGPQDAEQNLLFGLKNGLDLGDYLQLRAPKPTLMVTTTRDMFSIQGARDVFAESKAAFRAFGKEDHLGMIEDDAGHASTKKNRERTYAFFQKYLENPGSTQDLDVEPIAEEELYVTPSGNALVDLKGESMFSLNAKYVERNWKKWVTNHSANSSSPAPAQISELIGYSKPDGVEDYIFSGKEQQSGYILEKYLVKGSAGYYLPLLWLKPTSGSGKTVLFLDEQGKSNALSEGGTVQQLVARGFGVVVPDLSGIGELGNGFISGGDSVIEEVPMNLWFMGILIQKNLVAVRAEEIFILTEFIKSQTSKNAWISAVARGVLTTDLLHAAAMDNPFQHLVLCQPLTTYRSIVEERYYSPKFVMSAAPAVLPAYDLPDLVSMLSSQSLLLLNPVASTEQEVNQAQSKRIYRDAIEKADSGAFQIKQSLNQEDIHINILQWLDKK